MAPRTTKKSFIYEQIKQAIISGSIKPGEYLNEADLAQKYSIGKTPTREALLLLTHENLLESIPRVGYMVTRLTTKDFLEIYSLRVLLESEAIGLAVEHITPEEITQLEENNCEEAKLFAQSGNRLTKQAYRLNYDFHMLIARASGNSRLMKFIDELINDLERALSSDPYLADPNQHVEIINSLKARDKARAQDAMKAHLGETRLHILNFF
jgi:DNA-binding GntR family transcriptional regulator